ncbi:MAG: hypothetical protein ACFUZC_07250 [Chthoniobacteraceae bacterium]
MVPDLRYSAFWKRKDLLESLQAKEISVVAQEPVGTRANGATANSPRRVAGNRRPGGTWAKPEIKKMRIKVLVVDETTESWPAKNGKPAGEAKQLTCLDMDPHPGERFSNTFDYRLGESEVQFFGQMRDKQVEIVIREFETGFGGRLKCRGHLLETSVRGAILPESVTKKP